MKTDKVSLFCLPHAGGSATVYNSWKERLHPVIELIPVEMAGRGKRFSSLPYQDFDEVIEDLFSYIEPKLSNHKYCFFGHSMGCLLTFELIYKLKQHGYDEPLHLFFSGSNPPHVKKSQCLYDLPTNELITKIKKYGGTPKEIIENRELLDMYLPILKADFNVLDSYQYSPKKQRLMSEVSVLYGDKDNEILKTELLKWKNYTKGKCNFYDFEGNHFYLNKQRLDVINLINNRILYGLEAIY